MIVILIILTIIILLCLWIFLQTNVFNHLCSTIVRRSNRYRSQRRPKRIILIRHGESQGNEDSRIYSTVPDHAIGLTVKGQDQARHCGEELRQILGINDTLVCFVSPFRRSKETCELICESFPTNNILKVREDPRIREQEWGNFQDLASRDTTVAERTKIGRFFYRFRNGESGADVYDRVSSFMDSLYREMDYSLLPNNNIFIISHGLFMRLFLMRFFRWSVEKFHTLENFDNCGYCLLERNDEDGSFLIKTKLKTYADAKPLEEKDLNGAFETESFDKEVHPTVQTEHIRHHENKHD